MRRNSALHVALPLTLVLFVACGENPAESGPAGTVSSIVPEVAVVSNSWIRTAGMPRARWLFGMATVPNVAGQSIVYVMGGRPLLGGVSPTVQTYNIATNTWSSVNHLPTGVYRPNGAVVINGKIYISGGIAARRLAVGLLQMYDPATGDWTQKSPMPSPGFSGVMGVINNQVYVLTGCTGFRTNCEPNVPFAFYRYDPLTDQWASLPTRAAATERAWGQPLRGSSMWRVER